LLEKTKLGELTLSYMDEAGFVQTQPNRSAWTETGEVHLITAARGKRLNVMAALISTGELFKARNSAGLEADVDKILDGFGSHYRMTFC
jgi:hypothetical protein